MTGSIDDPAHRAQALDDERNRKMAISAHAYVRGSTAQFYAWLGGSGRTAVPQGPDSWICGDCHVGNLGPVADGGGQLEVQIRDLDQTVIGNPAHDLIRLGLSLAMAARGSDLPGITTAHMLERVVHGYGAAFLPHDHAGAMPRTVKLVMRRAAGRSWRHLADERIEGASLSIPLGKRFWRLTGEERDAVDALFATEPARRLVTVLRGRAADAPVRVLDAAYWRKGCSSLGLLRLAVLVAVGTGRHERHCLLDVKEATEAAAPRSGTAMPDDDAERVLTGALSLSPHLGGRMMATRLLGRPVFVRELLPQDLKLEVEHLSRDEAMAVAEFLAHVVGRAHARQLDEHARDTWRTELHRDRSRTLDAPCWLWDSVVDLVGTHESAYLEHCRAFAGRN